MAPIRWGDGCATEWIRKTKTKFLHPDQKIVGDSLQSHEEGGFCPDWLVFLANHTVMIMLVNMAHGRKNNISKNMMMWKILKTKG